MSLASVGHTISYFTSYTTHATAVNVITVTFKLTFTRTLCLLSCSLHNALVSYSCACLWQKLSLSQLRLTPLPPLLSKLTPHSATLFPAHFHSDRLRTRCDFIPFSSAIYATLELHALSSSRSVLDSLTGTCVRMPRP